MIIAYPGAIHFFRRFAFCDAIILLLPPCKIKGLFIEFFELDGCFFIYRLQ